MFRFGVFRLDPASRQLLRGDDPVPLTPRALDTLIVLVRNSGRVVSKEDLIAAVWDGVIVDENNLNQQISLLRKVLGDDRLDTRYIDTVPRKGYCFVAEVREGEEIRRRSQRPWRISLLAAALLLLTALAVIPTLLSTPAPPPRIEHVAVLPLDAKSEATLEHLGRGFAEDLTERLRNDVGLRVRGPAASSSSRAEVDAVLGGTIGRSANRIRFNVYLDRARDGQRLWSRTFESEPNQVVVLPSTVARDIAAALGRTARSGTATRRKPSFEAYDSYLKGRHHWGRRTLPDFEKAVEHYRRAIAIEPDYAEAHAGLAIALGFLNRPVEASAVVRTALALDPTLPELRAFRALTLLHYDFQPELARQEFERAVVLGPHVASVHHWYAFYFSYTSQHDKALVEIRRARELDPMSMIIRTDVGVILLWAGRYEEAAKELRGVLDLDPTFWNGHAYLALAYEQLGRPEEALKEWRTLLPSHAIQVPALVRLGQAAEARRLVSEEVARAADPAWRGNPTAIGQAYAALGDRDRAFEWLERAYGQRYAELMTLAVDNRYSSLRDDPRYSEMLARLNLGGP